MIPENYRKLNSIYPTALADVSIKDACLTAKAKTDSSQSFGLSLAAVSENILRVRIYKDSFVPSEYSFANELSGSFEWNSAENCYTVKTGGFEAAVCAQPFSLKIKNACGETVYEEQTDDVNPVGDGKDRIPPFGITLDDFNNAIGVNLCAKLRWNEHFFGLGERFAEFDKRGQQITMKNTDTLGCRDGLAYKNIPFYISSKGYGLFVNSHLAVQFNMGSESASSVSVHIPGECAEFYIITGDAKSVLKAYAELTGPAALPPDWSFGLWYSTGFKDSSEELVMQDAKAFRNKDIPCDVMHFDCYWLRENMWCDFVWNDEMYPDRLNMLKKLHEQGYKVCLWINPYVTITSEMYADGNEKGYFIKNSSGETYTDDMWHGLLPYCAILDITNKAACEWFKTKITAVLAEGVDILKTDFGENIPEDSVFHNGKSGAEMRNIYSAIYNELVFNSIKQVNGEGIVWARSGTAGMQKFPVCWSGDPRSSFEGMAETLRGGLSIGMSGVPFWSHDIGGFYGEVKHEVLARWAQFGLFSSHSRLHGTTTRQPWAYGEDIEKIIRKYTKLRYSLMPYILKTAKECVSTGLPFIRPLMLSNPDDLTAQSIWDQYYFGEDIIVVPVFEGDNASRTFYLPKGEWKDIQTGTVFASGWHTVNCSLDYMPILKKL